MSFLFDQSYYQVKKNGVSPFQNMVAYLGGSAFQTIGDNPVTAYRQLVQQYAKDLSGKAVDPKVAVKEANAVFMKNPVGASLSGLMPRLIGVLFKRVPKFGILLGYATLTGDSGDPGMAAATAASILSAPFINPVRMVEKQQRAFMKQTGAEKPIMDILREAAEKRFAPLFRGTVPLMGHSLASATLGLVGQPRLQKFVQKEVGAKSNLGGSATNLIASAVVSPVYVVVTNPLSRLEVIMQTNSIQGKSIPVTSAVKEMATDMATFGLRGIFRGQVGTDNSPALPLRVPLRLVMEGGRSVARYFRSCFFPFIAHLALAPLTLTLAVLVPCILPACFSPAPFSPCRASASPRQSYRSPCSTRAACSSPVPSKIATSATARLSPPNKRALLVTCAFFVSFLRASTREDGISLRGQLVLGATDRRPETLALRSGAGKAEPPALSARIFHEPPPSITKGEGREYKK